MLFRWAYHYTPYTLLSLAEHYLYHHHRPVQSPPSLTLLDITYSAAFSSACFRI